MNNVKMSWATDYTTVSNKLVNAFGLHPMTRFLCIYLSCQSNTFTFNNTTLCKALNCSEATLRKYMKEAIEHGLIERERIVVKGKFGYFSYTLIDPTTLQNLPHGKKTKVEKNQGGKSVRLNKEEVLNKEERINKEERGASAPALISEKVNDTVTPSPGSAPPPSPQDEFIKRATFSTEGAAVAGISGPKHPEGLPPFEQGSVAAYESILSRVVEDMKTKNDWEYQVASAGLKMTKQQFFVELKNWIKRNQNSYPFYCRPERVIRGGRASFASWLGNDISRGKYGANKQERRAATPTLVSRSPIRKTFTDVSQIA